MQLRRPSRPKRASKRGNTVPVQGDPQQRTLRAPHERDESADSQQAREPSGQRLGAMAHDDVERGVVDTDKGPVIDETYKREFRR